MDAIKYFKEKKRMTNDCNIDCIDCKLSKFSNGTEKLCRKFELEHPEEAIAIVEKWAEEHPPKTRQSEFLKLIPNADVDKDGVLDICPRSVERLFEYQCNNRICSECRKEYWLVEIGEKE